MVPRRHQPRFAELTDGQRGLANPTQGNRQVVFRQYASRLQMALMTGSMALLQLLRRLLVIGLHWMIGLPLPERK